MGTIHTRWPVARDHAVEPDDLDSNGDVSDAAIERWISHACTTYFEQCQVLERTRAADGLELRLEARATATARRLEPSPAVLVSIGTTEIFPTSFVVALRLRPIHGDRDDPMDVTRVVRLVDPVTGEPHAITDEIRDELIALEHAARHFN